MRHDDGRPLPLLMQMDAPDVRASLREICRRISQSGYYVPSSELYYCSTREFVRQPKWTM